MSYSLPILLLFCLLSHNTLRTHVYVSAARNTKTVELSYLSLQHTCANANPVSGLINVTSVAECEQKCDEQAANAPGTGQAPCVGVDSNGNKCYLKSTCEGNVGKCSTNMCGYRREGLPPSPPPIPPAPPIPPSPPGVTLRKAAEKHGIYIGAATNVPCLKDTADVKYKTTEQSQFSLTTAENACKWGPIHPQRDVYSFEDCDFIFANAEAANQSVRGHNLCWHTENPSWLLNGHFSPSELQNLLEEHITKVVKHYGERALAWDVVNEALDNNGLKPSAPWYPALKNYIDVAFTAARKAGGPNVKLFYNDYSVEGINSKSDQMYSLVKGMQSRGIPIDGVGLQFHWSLENHPPLDDVAANIKRFDKLGLEVHITELDIKCIPQGSKNQVCNADRLNAQAHLYAEILRTCLDAPNCKSVETWGFVDSHSWIGEPVAPLLFDRNYNPKPAVSAMIDLMLNESTV